MKTTTLLLLLPLALFALAACSDPQEPAAPASTDAPATAETPKPSEAPAEKTDSPAKTPSTKGLLQATASADGAKALSGDARSQIKEVAGFSDTISKTWDSIKGLDFSKKAEFVKKAMDLVSMAKDKIGLLKNVASSLPGGMGEKLMSQVGGLTGNITDLTGLLGKAGSIGSGDWSSYKGQIGSALNLLGGKFAGLGSL